MGESGLGKYEEGRDAAMDGVGKNQCQGESKGEDISNGRGQPGVQDTMGWSMGEATRHGVLILPDTCNGWGPL